MPWLAEVGLGRELTGVSIVPHPLSPGDNIERHIVKFMMAIRSPLHRLQNDSGQNTKVP
jgi:hypothetical protein